MTNPTPPQYLASSANQQKKANQQPKTGFNKWEAEFRAKHPLAFWSLVSFGAGVFASFKSGSSHTAFVLAFVLMGAPLLIGLLWFAFHYTRAIFRAINRGFDGLQVITTPMPSPPQIMSEMERQMGRPPTAAEYQIMVQWMQEQRRQALTDVAVGVGMLGLANVAAYKVNNGGKLL